MAGTFGRGDPTPLIVRQMIAGGTGGATNTRRHGMVAVSIPIPQGTTSGDGTGNAVFLSWINPEVGTIAVMDVATYWDTTGTGTFDLGRSSDGTGSSDIILDGATMNAVRVARRGRTGTEGGGTLGVAEWFLLGPGGTGTNNSLVGKTSEVTSTALGRAVITYIALDT